MRNQYKSILSKEVLAYNLSYHVEKCNDKSKLNKVIMKLLTSFEEKENSEKTLKNS